MSQHLLVPSTHALTKVTAVSENDVLRLDLDPENSEVAETERGVSAGTLLGKERTAAEQANEIEPDIREFPGHLNRYQKNTVPSSTNMTVGMQQCATVCAEDGFEMVIQTPDSSSGEFLITSPITFSDRVSIRGVGAESPRILCIDTDGFNYTGLGVKHVTLENLYFAQATRHTTTANTYFAIKFQGDTDNRPFYNNLNKIFIDGFGAAIKTEWMWETRFEDIVTVNCGNCVIATGKTVNNYMSKCNLQGNLIGLVLGDGTNTVEGWHIYDNLFFGNNGAIDARGAAFNFFHDNIVDHQLAASTAVLFRSVSTLPAFGNKIRSNFIFNDGAGNEAIRLLNNIASSGNHGNTVFDNEIGFYSGGSLNVGILVDGTEEKFNKISKNTVLASNFDCRLIGATDSIVTDNNWHGPGFSTTALAEYSGNTGTIISTIGLLTRKVGTWTEYWDTSIPTAGTYVRGDIVHKTNIQPPDVNSMYLKGWVRLTDGSGHVAGTDWALDYASHVTPAL